MATKEQLAALAIAGLVVAVVVVGALVYYSVKIRGSGTIKTVGLDIYSDAALTQLTISMNWGVVTPGENSTLTLYQKSSSTVPTNWTFTTQNWQPPEAGNYITLTWDVPDRMIQPSEILAVTYTMHVDPDVENIVDFTYDLIVIAVG